MELVLSDGARTTAGILLLALVTVESGGMYMLRLVRGQHPATPFQIAFARAGHAHAGVLVSLALICQLFAGATMLEGGLEWVARHGVAVAAILMPAGFFFSSMGRGAESPNQWIVLVYAGAISLALGVATLGIGLLTA